MRRYLRNLRKKRKNGKGLPVATDPETPEKYSSAVWLSDIEGKKHAEVARILKISLSGAKSRIQRGRKLLQYGYMDCCNFRLSPGGYLVGEHRDDCKVCNSKEPPVGT